MGHATRGILTWLALPRHGWQLASFIVGALAVGVLALALLCSVPPRYRKFVVWLVTFVSGLYYSMEFLAPPLHYFGGKNPLSDWRPFVGTAAQIISCFALLLGISNLVQIHGQAVRKRPAGWYNSVAFFLAFLGIMVFGFLKDWRHGAISTGMYDILFKGFYTSLDATMFSLVAFYIVSAAYRAFRIRSAEAAVMMLTAAVIMLALVPVGAALTSWLPNRGLLSALRLERVGYWILTCPNMAVQRAINFGIAVGSLAMGLRIWLGLERGNFFDRQL